MIKVVFVLSVCFKSFLTQEMSELTDGKKLIAKWSQKQNSTLTLELFWTISSPHTRSYIKIENDENMGERIKSVLKYNTRNNYYYFKSLKNGNFLPNIEYQYQITTYSKIKNNATSNNKHAFTARDLSPSIISTDLSEIQNNSLIFNFPTEILNVKNTELFLLISNEKHTINEPIIKNQNHPAFSKFQIALKCNKTSMQFPNLTSLLNNCTKIKKDVISSTTFYINFVFKSNLIDFIRYEVYESTVNDDERRLVRVGIYENFDEISRTSWMIKGVILAVIVVVAAVGISLCVFKQMKKNRGRLNIRRGSNSVANPICE